MTELTLQYVIKSTFSLAYFFTITEVAESVLQRSVELERFLVNSESFKIKLNYEFVDDNGQTLNKYAKKIPMQECNL